MAKFTKQTRVSQVPKTINRAGGQAFVVADPTTELLTMVGSSFFNERDCTYYTVAKPGKKVVANTQGMTDQAVKVLSLAEQIADGENPRDLLAIAHWARTEGNMRSTPCALLAVAAHSNVYKGTGLVRQYCSSIIQRADELSQVFLAYQNLYGRPFPNALKRGLAQAFTKFNEYGLVKYQSGLGDILKMVERRKDYPVSEAVREFLVEGTVSNPEGVPLIAARKELSKRNSLDKRSLELIKSSGATWENVISQFGNSAEVWEAVQPNMPYMATLRNLRNLVQANVSQTTIATVVAKLTDPEQVARSRQLPFRFFTAGIALEEAGAETKKFSAASNFYSGYDYAAPRATAVNHFSVQNLQAAVERALDMSVENIVELSGNTAVLVDVSGSMYGATVSQRSSLNAAQVSQLMGAICFKASENGVVIPFGQSAAIAVLNKNDSVIATMGKIQTAARKCGHATYAHKAVELLSASKLRVDRIVILSDMQCYGSMGYGADAPALYSAIDSYRRKYNREVKIHSVDLMPYGSGSQVPSEDKNVNLVSGWSEKIFNTFAQFEGLESVGDKKVTPTIEYIRKNF